MSLSFGRWLPLSSQQRLVADWMHLAQQQPSRTIERPMQLRSLVAARQAAWPRPGWCAIFVKGYALLAARRPLLRQLYRPFPWSHLYQHPENVASVAVARDIEGEEGVLLATLRSPENLGLMEIDRELRRCQEQPLAGVASFQWQLWLARLPQPLRRLLLHLAQHGPGRHSAHHVGTFGVSSLGGHGAADLGGPSLWPTMLTYGIIAADGTVDARLTYDARVGSAAVLARALTDLEAILTGEIVRELGYLEALEAA
jgi:hypothetical protein